MNRPDLTGLKAEILEYIELLEGCTAGASDLIIELNLVSKTLANDLKLIRTGKDKTPPATDEAETNATILITDKATDKKFERVIVMYNMIDKIQALASITAIKSAEKVDKPKRNIQDFIVKP